MRYPLFDFYAKVDYKRPEDQGKPFSMLSGPVLPSTSIWRLPQEQIEREAGYIHVYRILLDLPEADIQYFASLLSNEEHQRAERYLFSKHRARFIASRAQAKMILGRYTGLKPEQVELTYNPYGKPLLEALPGSSTLHFNVSHSHDLGLVAVTEVAEIGVDIEKVRPDIDYTHISRQFFSLDETERLLDLPAEEQVEAFYNIWTRKEAFIKGRGIGLATPLDQFDVSIDGNAPSRLKHASEEIEGAYEWTLCELKPGTGYVANLAVHGDQWQLSCWQWPVKTR